MSWHFSDIGNHVEQISTWNPSQSLASNVFRYIDLSSIDKDKKVISLKDVPLISSTEAPSRARQLVKAKDVLVALVRPNLNGVAVVPEDLEDATASTGYCVLRADNSTLDFRYLYHWVKTNSFVEDMMKKATGANYPAVSDKIIKESKIPLPPLAEQKRIVAILDKADSLRRKNQLAIQLADQFLRAAFLELFGDPVTNPKGWQLQNFEALGSWSSGGTPSRTNKNYYIGDLNWYSAGELNQRYLIESEEKISMEAIKNTSAKIFKKGSILLGMYDTAAFKASILTEDSSSNQACANLFPNKSVNIEWFYNFILLAKQHYLKQRRGVRQQNLNLGMIKGFELYLPPRYLQDKFSALVSKQNQSVILAQGSLASSDAFFKALSQKAFAGEL